MKEITFYRTKNFGGMYGCTCEVADYETIEQAIEIAEKDTWGSGYELYEVTLIFNGKITEKEIFLRKIISARDKTYIESYKVAIANATKRIAEHKANKRIGETTRTERINQELQTIKNNEEYIRRTLDISHKM